MLPFAKTNLKLSHLGLEEYPVVDYIVQKLSNGREIPIELKRQKVKIVQNKYRIDLKVVIEATFRDEKECSIQIHLKNRKILSTDDFIAISKRTKDIYPLDHLSLYILETTRGTKRKIQTSEPISNVDTQDFEISKEDIEKYFKETYFETQKKRKVEVEECFPDFFKFFEEISTPFDQDYVKLVETIIDEKVEIKSELFDSEFIEEVLKIQL